MNEIRKLVEKFRNFINSLLEKQTFSERDKRAVKIAAVVVAIFFGFMILKSLITGGENNKEKVVELEQRLQKVKELRAEYDYTKNLLNQMTVSIKKEDEALISVVEKILIDNQIERKSFSIKDSNINSNSDDLYNERSVQVDIKRVSLQKAIDVLYSIQNRESFLKVSSLKLKTKFDKNNLLDMSFRLSTFEFNKVL